MNKIWKKITMTLTMAIATIILWIPIYYFVIGAFRKRTDIVKRPLALEFSKMSFDNFTYAFKKMSILKALQNTGFITVVALVLIIICGSLAGFAIARIRHKIFNVFYTVIIALMVVPFIGALIPIVALISRMKLYDNLWGNVLIQTAWNLPFSIFLFTGFMRALPREMEDAAYIDGCTTPGIYLKIFLPLLKPVTATCCIRAGIGIWNDYLVSNSLLNSNKQPTLMVAVYQFFGAKVTEYGYAFAGIIMASLPIIIMFLFLQKYFIKGLVAGAVKG